MFQKPNSRNLIIRGFMILCLVLALAACSGGETPKETSSGGNESEEVFEFFLSSVLANADTSFKYLAPEFAKVVEERSNGRIKINVHYANELVPQSELLAALDSGTVDFGLSSPLYFSDTVPTANIGLLPYWTDSREGAYELMRESEVGEILEQEFEENGAKILAYDFFDPYSIFTNKFIEGYEGLNGLLVRSAGWSSDLMFKEMGISPTPVAAADIYDALQRGVINGAPFNYASIDSLKLGEVVDYVIDPPFAIGIPVGLYISMKTWDKLPADLQSIVQEVALEMEQAAFKRGTEDIAKIPEILEKYDIEVIAFSEEDQQKMYDSAQVVWDEFAKMSEKTAGIVNYLREVQKAAK